MTRILIIYPGALGDLLIIRPILYHLRDQLPGCQIDFAGNPDYLPLLTSAVDTPYDFHSSKLLSLFSTKPEMDWSCRAWLERYDFLIFWSSIQDPLIKTKLSSLKQCQVIYQSIKPPDHHSQPQTLYALQTLKPLGITGEFDLAKWIEKDRLFRGRRDENIIYIHPGSGSVKKNLPPDTYELLGRTLKMETGFKIILILGPAEQGLAGSFSGENFTQICPENVVELKGYLDRGKYFIGNDSGVSHLAAQSGLRTMTIFTTTNPSVWSPLGKYVYVVHNRKTLKNTGFYLSQLAAPQIAEFFLCKVFKTI